MKRVISLTFVVLLIFSLASVAQAAGPSYDVPEMDMTVSLPEGWIVFTKNIDAADPNLALLNTDKDTMDAQMGLNSNYLYAYDLQNKADIVISYWDENPDSDNRVFNIKKYDELIAELGSKTAPISDSLFEKLESGDITLPSGITATGFTKYDHPQAVFYEVTGSAYANDMDAKSLEYYTVVNGKQISLMLRSYSGSDVTDVQKSTLKDVVDSINFTKTDSLPDDLVKAYEKKIYSNFFYFSLSGLLATSIMSVLVFLLLAAFLLLGKFYMSNDTSALIALIDGIVLFIGLFVLNYLGNVKIHIGFWYIVLFVAASALFLLFNFKRNAKAYDKAYQEAMEAYNAQKAK